MCAGEVVDMELNVLSSGSWLALRKYKRLDLWRVAAYPGTISVDRHGQFEISSADTIHPLPIHI